MCEQCFGIGFVTTELTPAVKSLRKCECEDGFLPMSLAEAVVRLTEHIQDAERKKLQKDARGAGDSSNRRSSTRTRTKAATGM